MVRIRWALLGALLLIVAWGISLGHRAGWDIPTVYERLGTAAVDWGLAGLGAACYAEAADVRAHQLATVTDLATDRVIRAALIEDRMVAARILAAADRPSAALALAEDAYRADYSNRAAEALMWRLRYVCGARVAAKRELMALSLHSAEPEVLVALSACLADEGEHNTARALLEQALEENPRLATGWLSLARVLGSEGDDRDAARAARKAWQSARRQPAIRRVATEFILQGGHDTGYVVAGRSKDYYRRAAAHWLRSHLRFLAVVLIYMVALFWPSISGALKASHRDPMSD